MATNSNKGSKVFLRLTVPQLRELRAGGVRQTKLITELLKTYPPNTVVRDTTGRPTGFTLRPHGSVRLGPKAWAAYQQSDARAAAVVNRYRQLYGERAVLCDPSGSPLTATAPTQQRELNGWVTTKTTAATVSIYYERGTPTRLSYRQPVSAAQAAEALKKRHPHFGTIGTIVMGDDGRQVVAVERVARQQRLTKTPPPMPQSPKVKEGYTLDLSDVDNVMADADAALSLFTLADAPVAQPPRRARDARFHKKPDSVSADTFDVEGEGSH